MPASTNGYWGRKQRAIEQLKIKAAPTPMVSFAGWWRCFAMYESTQIVARGPGAIDGSANSSSLIMGELAARLPGNGCRRILLDRVRRNAKGSMIAAPRSSAALDRRTPQGRRPAGQTGCQQSQRAAHPH